MSFDDFISVHGRSYRKGSQAGAAWLRTLGSQVFDDRLCLQIPPSFDLCRLEVEGRPFCADMRSTCSRHSALSAVSQEYEERGALFETRRVAALLQNNRPELHVRTIKMWGCQT